MTSRKLPEISLAHFVKSLCKRSVLEGRAARRQYPSSQTIEPTSGTRQSRSGASVSASSTVCFRSHPKEAKPAKDAAVPIELGTNRWPNLIRHEQTRGRERTGRQAGTELWKVSAIPFSDSNNSALICLYRHHDDILG